MRCRRFSLLWAAALLALSGMRCFAACDFELQGEGHVAAIADGRTLRLTDGREILLTGIEIPRESENTKEILQDLAVGRDVTLHGSSDIPDRYGRQPAFVFIYGSDISLQEASLSAGAAIATGTISDGGCRDAFLAAEGTARQAKKGIWAGANFIRSAAQPGEILNDIGHFAIVEGTVVSARQSGSVFYLNFSRQWIQGFAVTISRRMMDAFAAAGMAPAALENKRIRVRGWVERRGDPRNGPRIEAVHPGQIEFVSNNTAAVAAQVK